MSEESQHPPLKTSVELTDILWDGSFVTVCCYIGKLDELVLMGLGLLTYALAHKLRNTIRRNKRRRR